MNYPAHSKFPFHTNGNAYRRDHDAWPQILILNSAIDGKTGEFAGVFAHFAGDEFVRQVERHSINADLIGGLSPEQAFDLGRMVEGGELVEVTA